MCVYELLKGLGAGEVPNPTLRTSTPLLLSHFKAAVAPCSHDLTLNKKYSYFSIAFQYLKQAFGNSFSYFSYTAKYFRNSSSIWMQNLCKLMDLSIKGQVGCKQSVALLGVATQRVKHPATGQQKGL